MGRRNAELLFRESILVVSGFGMRNRSRQKPRWIQGSLGDFGKVSAGWPSHVAFMRNDGALSGHSRDISPEPLCHGQEVAAECRNHAFASTQPRSHNGNGVVIAG